MLSCDADFGPCSHSSKCGKDEYLKVTLRVPYAGDWGNLTVRRPGPVRRTQTWTGGQAGRRGHIARAPTATCHQLPQGGFKDGLRVGRDGYMSVVSNAPSLALSRPT